MTIPWTWLAAQFDEKKVEPNSGLGAAIAYMQKRWNELTLFLRVPGAPLQNNICERILKKAILHRKNAYFFKTLNGARVGDIFMSLIHTCELNGANPFEYLTGLQKHADAVSAAPSDCLPAPKAGGDALELSRRPRPELRLPGHVDPRKPPGRPNFGFFRLAESTP